MSSEHTAQIAALARRSMLKTLRQPFQMFPIVFFPAILLAVNASGLSSATRLPGFPTHSYITFAIAVAFIQGAMFSLINTGTNLAEDIESGFFNRLALTPMRRVSLIAGMLLGVAVARRSAVGRLHPDGLVGGAHVKAGLGGRPRGPRARARWPRPPSARSAALLRCAQDRARRAGPLPAVLRVHLPILGQPAEATAADGLVSHGGDLEPDLLPDRGLSLACSSSAGTATSLWRGFAVAIGLRRSG